MAWVLLVVVALAYLAVGPWIWVLAAGLLCVPRVRARVPRPRFSWKGVGIAVGVLAVLGGVVVAVPDGALRIPTAGGWLVVPKYEGRQVSPKSVEAEEPLQHPWLADYALRRPGPLGDRTTARSAWYGLEGCRRLQFDSHGRLVAMCNDPKGPVIRVVDPESMRSLASKRLPTSLDGDKAHTDACAGTYWYLDNGDRVVVATTDARIQALGTSDANGDPDLTVDQSWKLDKLLPEDDCLVSVLPDWSGRVWWASLEGRVGVLDPVAGGAKVLELGERITSPFSMDETGAYVTTDTALYRLVPTAKGPSVSWRTEYDRGVEVKSGQLVQGSGSGPTLVNDNLVAIADNAEPRMQVVFLDRSTGAEVCKAGVFDGGESSTSTGLVSVGSGVVVVNDHGSDSTSDSFWGFAPTGGVARVDHREGTCSVVWKNAAVAPSTRPIVSWENGLLYTWTKRPTLWGIPAWYVTAIDVRDGRTAFSVRGGTGRGLETRRSYVTLGPKGSAYVGVVGGVVRVRDAARD